MFFQITASVSIEIFDRALQRRRAGDQRFGAGITFSGREIQPKAVLFAAARAAGYFIGAALDAFRVRETDLHAVRPLGEMLYRPDAARLYIAEKYERGIFSRGVRGGGTNFSRTAGIVARRAEQSERFGTFPMQLTFAAPLAAHDADLRARKIIVGYAVGRNAAELIIQLF